MERAKAGIQQIQQNARSWPKTKVYIIVLVLVVIALANCLWLPNGWQSRDHGIFHAGYYCGLFQIEYVSSTLQSWLLDKLCVLPILLVTLGIGFVAVWGVGATLVFISPIKPYLAFGFIPWAYVSFTGTFIALTWAGLTVATVFGYHVKAAKGWITNPGKYWIGETLNWDSSFRSGSAWENFGMASMREFVLGNTAVILLIVAIVQYARHGPMDNCGRTCHMIAAVLSLIGMIQYTVMSREAIDKEVNTFDWAFYLAADLTIVLFVLLFLPLCCAFARDPARDPQFLEMV